MLSNLALALVLGSTPHLGVAKTWCMDGSHWHATSPFSTLQASQTSQTSQTTEDKRTEAQKKADAKAERELKKLEEDILSDKKMGKEAADYYDREYKPTKDTAAQKRVEDIGERLALIVNANEFPVLWGDKRHSEFEYKFKVVDNPDVNAFSLPGGYIYVYQGLVDFAQSDEELAGVLAHEICHASQRHVATLQKEQAKMSTIQIPLILVGILTGGASSALAASTAGNLVGTAVTNGWSMKAETSADAGGYELMVAAGYDPTGMLTFMERLQVQQSIIERTIDLGIFRTHPPSKERADRIERFMRKDSLEIRRSRVTIEFRVLPKEISENKVDLYFGKKKLFSVGGDHPRERAKEFAKKLNEFLDSVPELFEVTTGENGVIFGRSKTLITLTEQDAAANNVSLEKLQNDASKAIRSSIFNLAYHIWDSRGG